PGLLPSEEALGPWCKLERSQNNGGGVSPRRRLLLIASRRIATKQHPEELAPHKAFKLAGGPVHRLIGGFALLGVLGDHLGRGRLREDLVADPRRGGRAGYVLDDLAARRIV